MPDKSPFGQIWKHAEAKMQSLPLAGNQGQLIARDSLYHHFLYDFTEELLWEE
jgi:hypothetical protein